MPSPSDSGSSSSPSPSRGLYGQRPSQCHDVIRRKQFERIAALTPLERMLEALELDEEALEVVVRQEGERPPRRRGS